MAEPFVSHDAADADGVRAEVWVQTGTGTITSIEKMGEDEGKNAYVTIQSSLAQVKKPIKGWIDKSDALFPKVAKAYEDKREIEYRMESQRKKSVKDRTIPIADLRPDMATAAQNTIMIFAGIDGELTREAVTSPAEDPAPGGRRRAVDATPKAPVAPAGPVFDKAAALTALATARSTGMDDSVVGASAAFALMAGATAKEVKEAGFTAQKATAKTEVRRARSAEAPPHVAINSDGRTNLGSYAVQAAFAAENVAIRLLADLNESIFQAHNAGVEAGEIEGDLMEAPSPVNMPQALAIAKMLLKIADEVQVGAYGGGRPDRMANSHTRSRALVFDAVRTRHPMPFGASQEEQAAWREAVITESVERFQVLAAASQDIAEIAVDETEEAAEAPSNVASVTTATRQQAAASRQKPPVEGEDGFSAPAPEVLARFSALVQAAGIAPTPDNPVQVYLEHKFGVRVSRKVHGPALDKLVSWYEQQGDKAGEKFQAHVMAEAGVSEQQSA